MIEAYQCGKAAWILLKQKLVLFIFISLPPPHTIYVKLPSPPLTVFPCFKINQKVPYGNQNVEKKEILFLKCDTFVVHFFSVSQNDNVKMFYRERN